MGCTIPEIERKPHLFLSHSSHDKDFVRKLANDLAMCEVDVWLDEWEINPGDSIYKAISNGIQTSKYIALIISNAYLHSMWGSEEVESAFSKQMDQKSKVIVPILIDRHVEIPPLLKAKLYIPFFDEYYYYHSLTKLTALIHDVQPRLISQAIIKWDPRSLSGVNDALAYCGIDAYAIIPKDIFEELASTRDVEILGK